MAYWCDDEKLNIEQTRLDIAQADAKKRMDARRQAEERKRVDYSRAIIVSNNL